jgi:hypothetical protein
MAVNLYPLPQEEKRTGFFWEYLNPRGINSRLAKIAILIPS